jgi:hypothetical protein
MSGSSPSVEWYEPKDDEPEPEDVPLEVAEMMTVADGIVWWSAAA